MSIWLLLPSQSVSSKANHFRALQQVTKLHSEPSETHEDVAHVCRYAAFISVFYSILKISKNILSRYKKQSFLFFRLRQFTHFLYSDYLIVFSKTGQLKVLFYKPLVSAAPLCPRWPFYYGSLNKSIQLVLYSITALDWAVCSITRVSLSQIIA